MDSDVVFVDWRLWSSEFLVTELYVLGIDVLGGQADLQRPQLFAWIVQVFLLLHLSSVLLAFQAPVVFDFIEFLLDDLTEVLDLVLN